MKKKKKITGVLIILLCTINILSCKSENNKADVQTPVAVRSTPCDTFVSPCMLPDSCNNPICQAEIRGMHRIREDSFTNMVNRYSEGADPVGDTLTTQYINSKIQGAVCGTQEMHFTDMHAPGNRIDFTVVNKLINANYSIQLFRGIMQLQPTHFVFYRAKKYDRQCNLKDDIVFKVLQMSPGTPARVIYYGDASDLLP